MAILVALHLKWLNCCGAYANRKVFFESSDIHEAAVSTLKCNWSNSWQSQSVSDGEFHDTLTLNTWSVDSGGHTMKDYRKESSKTFKRRWQFHESN